MSKNLKASTLVVIQFMLSSHPRAFRTRIIVVITTRRARIGTLEVYVSSNECCEIHAETYGNYFLAFMLTSEVRTFA